MARTVLPTNFSDDVLNSSMDGKRRYRMINNSDGTVSFEDTTLYDLEGSVFGASRVNEIAMNVNESADVADVGDKADLPYPTETICQNVSALGGFKFFVANSISLVAKVADDKFYKTDDGFFIIADSPTGQEMIDDITYKAMLNDENVFTWGADSASPFSKGVRRVAIATNVTAGTYSATSIPYYELLTSENFVFQPTSIVYGTENTDREPIWKTESTSISMAYNASNGSLVLTGCNNRTWSQYGGSDNANWAIGRIYGNIYCYY